MVAGCCGRQWRYIVVVQGREHLLVAVDAARTAGGHFEYVHMEAARLVPAQQAMIVEHLNAPRTEIVGQVGAALLRFTARKTKLYNIITQAQNQNGAMQRMTA